MMTPSKEEGQSRELCERKEREECKIYASEYIERTATRRPVSLWRRCLSTTVTTNDLHVVGQDRIDEGSSPPTSPFSNVLVINS